MSYRHRSLATLAALMLALLVTACAPSASPIHNPAALVAGQPYQPAIDPADFSDPKPNPYFPLDSGVTAVYEGGGERVEVTVTAETRVILGVTTAVITDQVLVDGELKEDTADWYATDNFGNVWYFGEQTAEYEGGQIMSTEGSWEAGVDGAQPGIVMLADPQVGDSYRQEFYAGEAEDVALVYALGESVTVPYGSYDRVVVTEDWTDLDPDVRERKWYAPGVGVVFEETVQGGSGTLSLVNVTRVP